MSSRLALHLVVILVIAAGCSPRRDDNAGAAPPFRARYAQFVLDVPDRADLYQARNHSWGLVVSICDRHVSSAGMPPLCGDLTGPVVGQFGLKTFVTEPRPGKQFALLKERPQGVAAPPAAPLAAVPDDQIDTALGGPGEAYELSRLGVLDQDAVLSTTANQWPMAKCANHPLGNRYCVIGFLIDGAFIEAHIFSEPGIALDQKQVWDVASALDAKLRALSPTPTK